MPHSKYDYDFKRYMFSDAIYKAEREITGWDIEANEYMTKRVRKPKETPIEIPQELINEDTKEKTKTESKTGEVTDDTPLDKLPDDYGLNLLRDLYTRYYDKGEKIYVKIIRSVSNRYNRSTSDWVPQMNQYIGRVAKIVGVSEFNRGIHLEALRDISPASFVFPPESLRVATPAEYEEIEKEQLEKAKILTSSVTYGQCYIKDGNGLLVGSFRWGNIPYCCGVSEVGHLSGDIIPPKEGLKEQMVLSIKEMIKMIKSGGPYRNGMSIATFVKKAGAEEFISLQWMEAFIEAGYKQIGEDYENHNHRGNILRSFYYQITPKGDNK